MPPLSPAQAKIIISPLSFLATGLKPVIGIKTANQRASNETRITKTLKIRTSASCDNIITTKPINTKRTAFNISSIRCQKAARCVFVTSLIASRRPVLPIKTPAITIAIGPETWRCNATVYAPVTSASVVITSTM